MNILSLSGGKDSTATMLLCLEKGIQIDDVVYVDVGWEFPQMEEHLEKLQSLYHKPFTILKPQPLDYWM